MNRHKQSFLLSLIFFTANSIKCTESINTLVHMQEKDFVAGLVRIYPDYKLFNTENSPKLSKKEIKEFNERKNNAQKTSLSSKPQQRKQEIENSFKKSSKKRTSKKDDKLIDKIIEENKKNKESEEVNNESEDTKDKNQEKEKKNLKKKLKETLRAQQNIRIGKIKKEHECTDPNCTNCAFQKDLSKKLNSPVQFLGTFCTNLNCPILFHNQHSNHW